MKQICIISAGVRSPGRGGQICGHSAAVALEVIHGDNSEPALPKKAAKEEKAKPVSQAGVQVILDSRLTMFWDRGRIPVRFEKGEQKSEALSVWLERNGFTEFPALATLDTKQAGSLLEVLVGHEDVWWGDQALQVLETPAARITVDLRQDKDDFLLTPKPWKNQDQILLRGDESSWVLFPEALSDPAAEEGASVFPACLPSHFEWLRERKARAGSIFSKDVSGSAG